ncbi:MAG: hypothetical protein AAFN77_04420 [Planctomycetota bacterium]
MTTFTQTDYENFAAKFGVDLAEVKPKSHEERIRTLESVLSDESVPYPIPHQQRQPYLDAAIAKQPFSIGPFGSAQVDLHKFRNEQYYEQYTFEEHLSWACLVAEQQRTKHQYACQPYLEGEKLFEIGGGVIPDYYTLNARIFQQTNWQLATVTEIIPAELFFTCHSQRYFPVTTFMRALGTDYLQEPDIGHDVAGHVATFTIPQVADVMRNHGEARNLIYAERDRQIAEAEGDLHAIAGIVKDADDLLAFAGRIYWFTVEFGLVLEGCDAKAFGAGILSSPGETVYSIDSQEPNRILIDPSDDADLFRIANTDYLISEFQKTYFVSKNFTLLGSLTPERILEASLKAMKLPDFTWREVAPGDQVIDVGAVMMSPNEKYYRLMAGQELDECLTRTAAHNLSLYARGFDVELLSAFRVPPPQVPSVALQWYRLNKEGAL